MRKDIKFILVSLGILSITVLLARFLLPPVLPFVVGGLLAMAAEPLVLLLHRRLHLPRGVASGIGIALGFTLLGGIVVLLCGLIVREMGVLARILPEMETQILSGLDTAAAYLLGLSRTMPEGIRSMMQRSILALSDGSSDLLDQAVSFVIHLTSGILSRIPGGLLAVGTCILSSFMISAQLPQLRLLVQQKLEGTRFSALPQTISHVKKALSGWLTAQCKLALCTFLLSCSALLLLHVRYAPIWAIVIAIVDAFPVLGTGTVLVPWSLIAFLQGQRGLAIGLLGVYGGCAVSRSVLEPRFLGKQLGLNPLVTLFSLYTGFRLWGIGGMLLSPIVAVTVIQTIRSSR